MNAADQIKPRPLLWATAVLITVAAVGLHLHFLAHAGGLWRDEVNLVNIAGHSTLAEMSRDSFPVLMPLAVHGWQKIGLGHSDFGLRCLGALIGISMIAALWLSCWTTRRSPPIVSLALFTLNSTVITYGDSLRAFGLASLFIVLTAATAWALVQKSSLPRAALFALAAVLAAQSLYQNAVLIGAVCLGAFAVCARQKKWRAAVLVFAGGLLAALLLTPYFAGLSTALNNSTNALRMGFQPDLIYENLKTTLGFPLAEYFWVWTLLAVVVIVAGLYAIKSKTHPAKPDARLFAAVTLLAALLGYAAFFRFADIPTQPWYFLPLLALTAACFDAGLLELPKPLRTAGFGLALATALAAVPFAWRDLKSRFTSADVLAKKIAAVVVREDFVIVNPWYCGVSFERYFKSTTPWTTIPPLADHSSHRYDLVQAQMRNPAALEPLLEKISATLRAGHRVFVVGWMDIPPLDAVPPKPLPLPPLKFSGWSDTPYAINWSAQTAHYLRQHARVFAQVKIPPLGPVNPNEDLKLFIIEGYVPANTPGK